MIPGRKLAALALGLAMSGSLLTIRAGAEESIMSAGSNSTRILFRFTSPASAGPWDAINDDVMGGLSLGTVAVTEDSCLLFHGSLSLENDGGFASIRTRPDTIDLSGYSGIRLRVQGDGRRYQFRLRLDSGLDGVAYKSEFQTVAGSWMEIDLPFASFQPSYRGTILKDAEPLVSADIRQVGFLIADRIEGEFSLLVREICAYR